MTLLLIIVGVVAAIFLLTVLFGAPYVPTHTAEARYVFEELYPVGEDDFVVDIGSGDGVVLVAAARRDARALGYEINPVLVLVTWLRLRGFGGRAHVRLANFWTQQLPDETTVVYTFGESRDITKMYNLVAHQAARIKRPVTLISYGFPIPDRKPNAVGRAHYVYKITPLQPPQA